MNRILIVDDEPGLRTTIRRFLTGEGYAVETAGEINEALARQRAEPFDVIVSDIIMPGCSGVELLQGLNQDHPDVKVILITGEPTLETATEAVRSGAFDYLAKPIVKERLLSVVRAALAQKKLEDENRRYREHLEELVQERTRQLNDHLERISQIARNTPLLTSSKGLDELCPRALEMLAYNMNVEGGCVYVREGGRLRLVHSLDPDHQARTIDLPPPPQTVFGQLFEKKEAFYVNSIQADDQYHTSGWTGYRNGSFLAIPYFDDAGEITLVMGLHNKKTPPFSQIDIEIARIIAAHINEVLNNIRLNSHLSQSEAQYRLLIEQASDVVVLLDPEGRIIFCSPAVGEIGGHDLKEVLGRNFMEFIVRETDRIQARRLFERIVRNRKIESFEFLYAPKNRAPFYMEAVGKAIASAGEVTNVHLVLRDISARRRIEESHRLLATAIEQLDDVVVITDRQGKIVFVNPAFERITGYSQEEACGETPRILKSGKHDIVFYKQLWETIASGREWAGRIINKRKNGELYADQTIISPVRDNSGAITHFVSRKRDVTKEIEREDVLQQALKMETIGRLVGGVAHDLNNILMPVIGFSEMLVRAMPKENPGHEPMTIILEAGRRGADLIRQLMAFSRKQILQLQPIDINDVIKNFEKLLRRTIREDVAIAYALDGEPCIAIADRGQLEQIVLNVAVNAQDAMARGGVLTIRTGRRRIGLEEAERLSLETAGAYAFMSFTDTGTGIPREVLDKIFEPFFTTKEAGKGTGLGLSTVFGIVTQHKGQIEVHSVEGEGTTFRFYFPAGGADAREQDDADRAGLERTFQGTETILIAEDNIMALRLAQRLLGELGYTVLAAADGEACIELARAHQGPIHLLLTDLVLPGINGLQIISRIKAMRPGVRIIVMSGYPDDVTKDHGALHTRYHFIAKPFSLTTLASHVRKVLDAPAPPLPNEAGNDKRLNSTRP